MPANSRQTDPPTSTTQAVVPSTGLIHAGPFRRQAVFGRGVEHQAAGVNMSTHPLEQPGHVAQDHFEEEAVDQGDDGRPADHRAEDRWNRAANARLLATTPGQNSRKAMRPGSPAARQIEPEPADAESQHPGQDADELGEVEVDRGRAVAG